MTVRFGLLGPFEVHAEGRTLELGGRKQRGVLARLVVADGEAVPVEELVESIWGSDAADSAARSVQVYVSNLRRILSDASNIDGRGILRRGAAYALEIADAETDADDFERRVQSARSALDAGDTTRAVHAFRAAGDLWRGPALADLDELPFQAAAAAALEEARIAAEEGLVEALLASGDTAAAVGELETLTASHPFRERLRGLHMQALYADGRQAEALNVYDQTRRLLGDELGVDPSPELQRIQRQVLEQDLESSIGDRTRSSVHMGRREGLDLPTSPTVLIGRSTELEELEALLDDRTTRLVTLTGPGGSGKTRLALELAHGEARRDARLTAFVDLSAVTDARLLTPIVGPALGVKLRPDRLDEDHLAAELGGVAVLLVLDNLEQIDGAGEVIAELLTRMPGLTIVATSRGPLRVRSEQVFPVPPLTVASRGVELEELAKSPAVELFVTRARAVDPAFVLGEGNGLSVQTICERLDGLPLSIELAAARCDLLSPAQIAERLDDRFRLLDSGPGDLPERQQSLHATIAWSVDLLDVQTRTALEQLSMFAGPFTLEAADAVLDGVGDPVQALTQLLDRGLLRTLTTDGERLHVLLETVRAFASAQLDENGDSSAVQARHAAHYAKLAHEAGEHSYSIEQSVWEARVRRERGNLRVALARAIDGGDRSTAVRIASGMLNSWRTWGEIREGAAAFDAILDMDGELTPDDGTKLFRGAGFFAFHAGDAERALELFSEGIEFADQLEDDADLWIMRSNLATMHFNLGNLDAAEETDRAYLEWALSRSDDVGAAFGLQHLAEIALARGDPQTAITLFSECRDYVTRTGDPRLAAATDASLARAVLAAGDAVAAIEHAAKSLRGFAGLESLDPDVKDALCAAAGALMNLGSPLDAARVMGFLLEMTESGGSPLPPSLVSEYEEYRSRLQRELGERLADQLQAGAAANLVGITELVEAIAARTDTDQLSDILTLD